MTNFLFYGMKGRWIEKYKLLLGTDNIVLVVLQSGQQADSTLAQYTDLATLLASNPEATATNYPGPGGARIALSSSAITIVVNNSTGVVSADLSNQTISSIGGALNNTFGALLTCYRPAAGSPDSAILPCTKHDFTYSTTGGNMPITIPSIGSST
jgi:hypothetical protein